MDESELGIFIVVLACTLFLTIYAFAGAISYESYYNLKKICDGKVELVEEGNNRFHFECRTK